ncbi:MAG: hypothetical protein RIM99_14235 [Cyclobacteriaceae bacterium]
MKNRKCEECANLIFGRADKKFCDDNCRNAFNNRINAPATNFVRNVNNTLGKNRRILVDLNPHGEAKIHRDKLLKKGFDFEYYTSSHTTKSGDTYRFCYDQGYLITEGGTVLLVTHTD